MNFLYILQQSFLQRCFFFFHEVFHLLLQSCIFIQIFADCNTQIRSIVEESLQVVKCILYCIQHFFHACSSISFNTANAGSNRTFGDDFYHTDISGCSYMCTTTELDRSAELDHTNSVAILFTKESDSSQLLSFLDRNIAIFFQWDISADSCIDDMFNFTDFFIGHFLEVREVETQ